jgi:hypothetical protein
MKADISTETPIWLALNKSKVVNNQESFDLMDKVGPRVCITTATHPGFVGFQANIVCRCIRHRAVAGVLRFRSKWKANNLREVTCVWIESLWIF